MQKNHRLIFVLSLASVLGAGCQQTSQQRRPHVVTAPAAAPMAAPMAARQNCTDPTRGLVALGKQMPKEVSLGQTFEYLLTLNSQDCVDDVVVTDHVPEGATFVKSEPAAEVSGDLLTWHLKQMDAGQSGTIRVSLKADREGTLASCATISANPRVCATTLVGKPALAIEKTGPESALLGSTLAYNVTVSNKGTAVARDVVVTDPLPDGLAGSPVSVNVGDLGPNQSKSIPVSFTAPNRGRFCNVATAESSNAGKVTAEVCTVVLQPGLKITKEGTKEQFLGRNASYNIVVSNTGDTTLTGVVVTDMAPAGTSVVDAGGGSVAGNNITWNLGDLPKESSKTLTVALTSMAPGNLCNTASVNTAQGLTARAEACTVWRGVSALLLEKGDNPDPIQVGEQTTYFVRVTNQGTAPDADVLMVVEFPKELTPVSADNNGRIEGQTVTFPAFPNLAPKQAFEYHIVAKGAAPGDARVTFTRTSRDIPAPTRSEESTRVY
jgi:uncharacterized repeat protein (TIGR01451 family)